MRAAVVTTPESIEMIDAVDPTPMDHQAVVAVSACGICVTDVQVRDGDHGVVRYPVILGYEFAGTAVAVGKAARGVAMGDRVTGAGPIGLMLTARLSTVAATVDVVTRGLTIIGINSVRHSFGRARALLAAGAVRTDLLRGEALSLAQLATGIESTRTGIADLKTRVSNYEELR